jgi:GT2 family glycosyltransferase
MAILGLVTVLFNSDNVLEGFFKSLSLQTYQDFNLYIIDNTPSVETDLLLSDLLKKNSITTYYHIKNSTNVGVAKGNNQGIELSLSHNCKYTLLLNNDIEFSQPKLLGDLVEIAEERNENLIVPKILFFENRKIWMAGGKMNLWLGVTSHIGYNCQDNDMYDYEIYVSYAPTCFMLIRNTVFEEIGIMDEQYFVYYDDTDFVYRAQQKMYNILYSPQFCILHKVSSSTGGEDSKFAVHYMLRNRILFIRKNFRNVRFFLAMSYCFLSSVYRYIKKAKYRKTIVSAFLAGISLKIK